MSAGCNDACVLDWKDFDPASFERAVQILLRERFGAVAIDGSGGDEAQDSRLVTPDGLEIFEVKSFSKRLAASQKKQIAHSLGRAVELHSPRRWVLVTRSNPTPLDTRWLDEQAAQHAGCRVEWFGVDWLDSAIAGREDLVSYLEGPDYKLLRRARQLDYEAAAAADGKHLVERLAALNERSSDISPFWRWDSTLTGDGLLMTLRAKTPDAATVDPIVLRPTFAFPADDSDAISLQVSLDQALRFGGDVEVPAEYVVDFDVDTVSDATRRLVDIPRKSSIVRFVSEPDTGGLPVVVDLIRVTTDGQRDRLHVQFTHRLRGSDGATLHGSDLGGVLDVALRMPHQPAGKEGGLTLDLRPVTGRFAHQVSRTLTWMAARTSSDTLEVSAGGHHLATFSAGPTWTNDIRHLARLVDALEALEEHARRPVRIPTGISSTDLLEIELACRALSGQRSRLPIRSIGMTVRAGQLRGFLDAVPPEPGALYIGHDIGWEIGDDIVTVTGIATWCSGVTLANRSELEALSLDVSDHLARFEALDGHDIAFIRAVKEPGEPWTNIPS
jgi:hypothetical protein